MGRFASRRVEGRARGYELGWTRGLSVALGSDREPGLGQRLPRLFRDGIHAVAKRAR